MEKFLNNLKQRGCNFHIVFFESHKFLSFNHSKAETERAFRFILIREAFIRHLQRSLSADNPVKVHHFSSMNDVDFGKYLAESKPYFCMAHDVTTVDKDHKEQHLLQSGILWQMMRKGYNVALLDKLEFKDSKAMTLVNEGHGFDQFSQAFDKKAAEEMADALSFLEKQHDMDQPDSFLELSSATEEYITHPREYTVIAAMSAMVDSDFEASALIEKFGFAFLQHTALLHNLTLEERCLPGVEFNKEDLEEIESFVNIVCRYLSMILGEGPELEVLEKRFPGVHFDLCDVVDIRLFKYCLADLSFGNQVSGDAERLSTGFEVQTGIKLKPLDEESLNSKVAARASREPAPVSVLPFLHTAFDSHLSIIKLNVDQTRFTEPEILHHLFQERTHWHSTSLLKSEMKVLNKWQHRQEQLYHSHMQRYAASITGRTTQSLDPELILVGEKSGAEKGKKGKHLNVPEVAAGPSVSPDRPHTKKGPKNSPSTGRKKADIIREANMNSKAQKTEEKIVTVWEKVLDEIITLSEKTRTNFEFEDTSLIALAKLSEFQKVKLKADPSTYVYLETQLYRLKVLLELWGQACQLNSKEKEKRQNLGALILDEARHILASPALTKKISEIVKKVWVDMGFGQPGLTETPQGNQKLSSKLEFPRVKPEMKITMSPIEFQLTYSGPYMDRSFGSAPDPRVKFNPDTWQKDVLDQIDAEKSVFVVAPTSAGKTFISFYAMEKVLRGSNSGVLVYVAPTKALVNQIAAEVLARFTKNYPHAGNTVWAIHTRDYRINDPEHCQILVTVPHILQIMLLSPQNAGKWAPRVKRIIFDEIHSIGQADDGVIWEQLLLIAPCPIIALSATVGNPGEFRDWLVETQKAANIDLKMIEHKHRYSDLRKFIYETPYDEQFIGLDRKRHFEELDDEPNLESINPISTLLDIKHRALPDDLNLEPRDCLELYHCMVKHQMGQFRVGDSLNPSKWFQGVIGKVDVVKWEAALKAELGKWMANHDSPFDKVMKELTRSRDTKEPHKENKQESVSPSPTRSESAGSVDDAHDNDETVQETTISLLTRLHSKNALPAIFFSFDRTMVEKTVATIVGQLEKAEAKFKNSDLEYLKELKLYDDWVKQQSQRSANADEKASKKKEKKKKGKDDDVDARKDEKNQDEKQEASKWASFDPNAPNEKFLFTGKVNPDVEEDFKRLRKASIPEVFIIALRRGIGIHHAGLSRKLREVTETLFRMGYLRVVIATETLALGINMPCKTVGFIGDSVYLTALSYRQCAGRAGRRGFDLFGNVIFHGIPQEKVNRLISSRLPSLKGHFPISTSLVLRLFSLIDGSQESPYSRKAVSQLLSQSRLFLGGDSFKEQVLHHLRFSIEYLRRQHLIDARGQPINFAGLVGHLYYTENSAFAFHALIKEGVFHTICKDVEKKPQKTCMMLMLLMPHIFGRRRCKQPKEMSPEMLEIIKNSPSDVYLAPIPEIAKQALIKHNEETLKIFTGYALTFATQYCQQIPDNILPFTNKAVGAVGKAPDPKSKGQIHAKSAFYRLSGQSDTFESVEDLAASARNGVFLEPSAIPIIDIEYGYYNAYLLDFYKHGSTRPLITANGLRGNDVWFMLNDFSMILATIVTSIKNFFSEKEVGSSDDDLLDLLAMEEGEQVEAGDDEEEVGFGEEDDEGDIDISKVNHAAVQDPKGMLKVFKAFVLLKKQFDAKLAAIGATKRPEKKGKAKKPRLVKH
ncbi:hypothetical protein ABW20_dc0102888 [Dactylellina cionopaga]|nr:hypothetical protein ABW20_dc0102888 [Dactylellina cionopaga]